MFAAKATIINIPKSYIFKSLLFKLKTLTIIGFPCIHMGYMISISNPQLKISSLSNDL
jgi:hypothetical protein